MKKTESGLRQYIRRLILETFYATPSGQLMSADDVRKQEPGFFGRDVPDNVSGHFQSHVFDFVLAKGAKEDLAMLDPDAVSKISTLLGGSIGGSTLDLNNLNFDRSDLGHSYYFSPDENYALVLSLIDSLLSDEQKYIDRDEYKIPRYDKDGNESDDVLAGSISDIDSDLARYVNFIMNADLPDGVTPSTGFPVLGSQRLQSPNRFKLSPTGVSTFNDTTPIDIFFMTPEEEGGGLGKSLIDRNMDLIMRKLRLVRNMTPVEFHELLYPELEEDVRKAYEGQEQVKANPQLKNQLDRILEAYLESISFVVRECIAEINFHFCYDNPDFDGRLLFMPTNPVLIKFIDDLAEELGVGEALSTHLGLLLRPQAVEFSHVKNLSDHGFLETPVPRDMPNYYETKFNVRSEVFDPDLVSNAFIKQVMFDNMYNGVDFRKMNINVGELEWDMFTEKLVDVWWKS